ncbi:MAG: MgtC/SapB family protein [Deltaproteobacteria bacterium]|nr:MgtC/SapB family protein [Deltaproteobacteria bacterium]
MREALLSLLVAVAAGALIGAERQQAQAQARDFGGIRTFPLVSLVGALGALARPAFGPWLVLVLLAAVTGLLAISHARTASEDPGVSSEIAALVTFALGVIAASPDLLPTGSRYLLVAAIAGLTMALLALKRALHGFIATVSTDDVYATAKFVVLAAVVLPTLPNRAFGPFGAINPFKVGMLTALIAGLSFTGYVATRVLGTQRGLLVTGLAGGLVSSTAVTLTFAARARELPAIASLCTVTIVAASATMFARVLVVVGAVDQPLMPPLLWPLIAMTAVGGGVAVLIHLRDRGDAERPSREIPLRNPFELASALKFGALYAVVLLGAKAAEHYLGHRGVYVSALVAGLADVDAITLSIAELHRGGLSASSATTGIVLAVCANTVVKAGLAASIGGRALGVRVGGALLGALAAGLLVLALIR